MENTLKDVSKKSLMPLEFITNDLTGLYSGLNDSMQSMRNMTSNLRGNLTKIINEVISKTVNITIPLRQVTFTINDSLGRVTGVLATILNVTVGSYDTLFTLFGALAELLGILLVPLFILIIALCYILPFGWIAAIPFEIISIIISIFIAISLIIQAIITNENPITCFDKNTQLIMANGSSKSIIDIQVGDKLEQNIIVTDKMKFCAKTIEMYKLPDNTIVSGYHYIKYKDKFILVRHHPERERIYNYNEPFIYCINTSTKRIFINNIEYLDWEDKINNDTPFRIKGFNTNTQLSLYNGNKCFIQNIQIGDILSHGEKVFGLVETLDKTYHLFTDKKSFHINDIKVNHYDYD